MAFQSTLGTGIFLLHVWSCQFFQQFYRIVPARRTQSVVRPFALLTTDDDAGIAEDLHVMGQGGLADLQRIQQLAGAFFAALQQPQDLQPVFIAQGLEHPGPCP